MLLILSTIITVLFSLFPITVSLSLLPLQSISIKRYIGAQGFAEVTDWDYFDETGKKVEPPPFDPSQPKRTVNKGGGSVRLFLGEVAGVEGAKIRSKGGDSRILIKEYNGLSEAARREEVSLSRLLDNEEDSSMRGINGESCVVNLMGKWNATASDFDKNEWYSYLKISPPSEGVLFLCFEWAGLSTLKTLCTPSSTRLSKLSPKRGLLGQIVQPPAIPDWSLRTRYALGIVKKVLEGMARIHEGGVVHNSVGSNSIVISSLGQDKSEAASLYATTLSRCVVKFSDFGFSSMLSDSTTDSQLIRRAKGYKIDVNNPFALSQFAIAEDLSNLGFALLEFVLGFLSDSDDVILDNESLQRQFDLMDSSIYSLKEYLSAETQFERVVNLLSENENAGWDFFEGLLNSRERVSKNLQAGEIKFLTARSLLLGTSFLRR